MNMHLLHGLSFYTFLVYHDIFFKKINKYQLLYCILQYADAVTWLTEDLFEEKKTRVMEIYS